MLAAAIFGDPFTWPIAAGIGLIIAGVLLVEFGSQRSRRGRIVMWLALAGAIIVEVFATLSLRASDGFRKKAWIVPVVARLPRVVLSAVADAVAGHARRHRLRRVDGVRRRAGRGHRRDTCSPNR